MRRSMLTGSRKFAIRPHRKTCTCCVLATGRGMEKVWTARTWVTEASDSSLSMYYDARTRQLRFSSLEQGDIVEIEYSISPNLRSSPYGKYFGELVFFA